MAPTNTVRSFRLARRHAIGSSVFLAVLFYFACTPDSTSPSYLPIYSLANSARALLGEGFFTFAKISTVVIHTGEAIAAMYYCRRFNTGLVVGAQYTLATLVFGGPTLMDLLHQGKQNDRKD